MFGGSSRRCSGRGSCGSGDGCSGRYGGGAGRGRGYGGRACNCGACCCARSSGSACYGRRDTEGEPVTTKSARFKLRTNDEFQVS